MENKKIIIGVVVVVAIVGIYLLTNNTKVNKDGGSTSSSTYSIPMGATNAPDPAALERISRQKIDMLINQLKPGQTSDQVLELQTELQKLGYIVKSWKPTKFYGTVTMAGVAKYNASKK
jgi:hypothetical protein